MTPPVARVYDGDEPTSGVRSFSERRAVERRELSDRRGDGGGPGGPIATVRTVLGVLLAAISVFTSGYAVGINSNGARIEATRDEFHSHVEQNAKEHEKFAQREAVSEQFQSLQRQLDQILAQNRQLLEQLARRREP